MFNDLGRDQDQVVRCNAMRSELRAIIDNRVGSFEVGNDADIALYAGDPFGITAKCIGVVVDGKVVSETSR